MSIIFNGTIFSSEMEHFQQNFSNGINPTDTRVQELELDGVTTPREYETSVRSLTRTKK